MIIDFARQRCFTMKASLTWKSFCECSRRCIDIFSARRNSVCFLSQSLIILLSFLFAQDDMSVRHCTNAYMLVYLRDSHLGIPFCVLSLLRTYFGAFNSMYFAIVFQADHALFCCLLTTSVYTIADIFKTLILVLWFSFQWNYFTSYSFFHMRAGKY